MRYQGMFAGLLSLLGAVALSASCGSNTANNVDRTPGETAVEATQTGEHELPPVEPVVNANEAAPLGTNPEYSQQLITPEMVSFEAVSKAMSALAPGQKYKIVDATVTAGTVTNPALVNFDAPASSLVFDEGTNVNLWIKYETVANAEFNWKWRIDAISYVFQENRTQASAGVATYYMPMVLPVDQASSADKNAKFICEFSDKVTSVVVIPPDEKSVSVDFVIKNVPYIPPPPPIPGGAYMCWEDLIKDSDYDYNDFLAGINSLEYRRASDGKVVQIFFRVKAIARGAGYDSDWQFNMDTAFPGASATAYIQEYKANGTPDGSLRIWKTTDGADIPVFVKNKTTTLPVAPNGDGFSTNVKKDSTFVHGDYSDVTIVFNTPMTVGTYVASPYRPSLKVRPSGSSSTYVIKLWTKREFNADGTAKNVDVNKRPLAFIIPGNFAWMMESRQIWIGYPRFNNWVTWINNKSATESSQPTWWLDAPVKTSGSGSSLVYNTYQPSLFKGTPPTLPILF